MPPNDFRRISKNRRLSNCPLIQRVDQEDEYDPFSCTMHPYQFQPLLHNPTVRQRQYLHVSICVFHQKASDTHWSFAQHETVHEHQQLYLNYPVYNMDHHV